MATDNQTIKYIQLHQSLVVLMVRIFLLQVVLTLGFLIVRASYQSIFGASLDNSGIDFFIVYMILKAIDIIGILIIALLWANKYYRISPESVSAFEGWINKKTDIISMRTISSVKLKQSFLGRIFGYGVIRVECMFSKQVIHLKYITKPHHFRKMIQNLTSEAMEKAPVTNQMSTN
ncbi:PH domain-containing protein [Candidatus Peregrinibacteria bacterium]|nr:PH domain-containing protein [Candidatus Peregrinibacteria bacterium]